jgi:hypothetical protein
VFLIPRIKSGTSRSAARETFVRAASALCVSLFSSMRCSSLESISSAAHDAARRSGGFLTASPPAKKKKASARQHQAEQPVTVSSGNGKVENQRVSRCRCKRQHTREHAQSHTLHDPLLALRHVRRFIKFAFLKSMPLALVAPSLQAIFRRRRHQPRRPPLVKIRPGRPSSATHG